MTPPPMPPGKPEGDASKIVNGFRDPIDAYLSMAKMQPGEAHTWGIYASRHAGRASRNKHRLDIMRKVAMATRSEDAWGSHEAADVAKGNQSTPGGFMDSLIGLSGAAKPPTPPKPQPQNDSGQGPQ